MLTCQEVTELVTNYLEGKFGLMQRMSFQFHLGMCGNCREYLRQMKLTINTVGILPEEDCPIPPEVESELVHRFRNWKR